MTPKAPLSLWVVWILVELGQNSEGQLSLFLLRYAGRWSGMRGMIEEAAPLLSHQQQHLQMIGMKKEGEKKRWGMEGGREGMKREEKRKG